MRWSSNSQYPQNGRGEIDVSSWQIVFEASVQMRSNSDQCIVDVIGTERRVRSLSCWATPIGIDQTGDSELILIAVPSKRHDDIRRIGHINVCSGQRKRSLAFVGEDDSSKITLLQPLDQTSYHCRIVIFDIEQKGSAVAADKYVTGLG